MNRLRMRSSMICLGFNSDFSQNDCILEKTLREAHEQQKTLAKRNVLPLYLPIPGAEAGFHHLLGHPAGPGLCPGGFRVSRRNRLSRRVPLHPRHPPDDVPRPLVDHAPVCRVRHAPRNPTSRYRYLLDQGQTGLSVAFDLPTQIGYDADDPHGAGEVGKVGVSRSPRSRTWKPCSTASPWIRSPPP